MGIRVKRQTGVRERKGNGSRKRSVRLVAILAIGILVGCLAGVGFGWGIRMPQVDTLTEFTPALITQLADRNDEVYATYAREKRVLLDETEIPELLTQAMISAEDSNFYQHGGVDPVGVLRAVIKNALQGRRAMGGSTITMQLARLLFLSPEKKFRRKIEEAFLSVQLEKTYTKNQILTYYFNLVYLGQAGYGMESAANSYFGKGVDELTIAEAATLAGIVQTPTKFNPYREPELVVNRRNYVIRRMLEEGYITPEEHRAALDAPLVVVEQQPQALFAPYFAEEVRQYLDSKYGTEEVLNGGLKVQTTLDPQIQRASEKALRTALIRFDRRRGWRGPTSQAEGDLQEARLPSWARSNIRDGDWSEGIVLSVNDKTAEIKIRDEIHTLTAQGVTWKKKGSWAKVTPNQLNVGDVAWFRMEVPEKGEPYLVLEQEPEVEGAAVVIESSTGAVRGMVGGWSYERSKFNRVTQAKRQVGSAFKPFVFGAALETGFTAADTILDAPAVFMGADAKASYSPRNYYRKYYGILTLRRALELSANVTSVKLLDLVGVDQVIDFARRSGIQSELPPYPSLALGSADLTPIELAAAYAAIANEGTYVEPYLVERIERPDGRVLERNRLRAQKSMEPEIAYILTQMLVGVVQRGTAKTASKLDVEIGGKTGTTNAYSDAWFAGFTPRYTILSWVGYNTKRSLGANMTGAEAALPVWKGIIETGLEEGWVVAGEKFVPPPNISGLLIDYKSGLLADPGTEAFEEFFVAGTEPTLRFQPKWERINELPWYQQETFYIPKAGENMPGQIEEWALVQEAWGKKR